MPEFWETNFQQKKMMWGEAPALSALLARDYFVAHDYKNLLIPGIGYGRNALPFLDAGLDVTGIEISQTAIDIARNTMGLRIPIYHGSVTGMPFDTKTYEAIFCHALIHLLDEAQRKELVRASYAQLAAGGTMIFTAVSTAAPSHGQGVKIGHHRFEQFGGAQIFFYDAAAIHDEFDAFGLMEIREIIEPHGKSTSAGMPFLAAICEKK